MSSFIMWRLYGRLVRRGERERAEALKKEWDEKAQLVKGEFGGVWRADIDEKDWR